MQKQAIHRSFIYIILTLFILILSSFLNVYADKSGNAKYHRDQGINYINNGMVNEAIKEFEKSSEASYKNGYNAGKADAERQKTGKIYTKYIILSILTGLYFSAIFIVLLWWADISSQSKAIKRWFKVKGLVRKISIKLKPELFDYALKISKSKEKLREAIKNENDIELNGIASSVLPRLDDLVRQAFLVIERQQLLSDYIEEINQSKLENEIYECEEKIKDEKDQEAKEALQYNLAQLKNKHSNYSKVKARLRTSDAILKGISARIDATSLDLLSLPSILIKKQEFFERISAELEAEIGVTKKVSEILIEETI